MAPSSLERRLCAVVSGDVFGYGRLMADDEAATVRTVGRYREEIELLVAQFGGRLVDFTGDNFLAEFRTATEALDCSLDVHRVVEARNAALPSERRMHFRIGIHLGEVTAEEDRLFGDGVNIAARLEALAEPGGICVSAAVRDQVRRDARVTFEDLGARELKNIPAPVHAFKARGLAPIAAQPAGRDSSKTAARLSLALAAIGLVALATSGWLFLREPQRSPALSSSFRLPVLGDRLANSSFPPIAISPDGRRVVYAANAGSTTRLYLRSLDRFEAEAIEGTEGAVSPFFSPNGSWVGFFTAGTIQKVPLGGGRPVQVSETSNFAFPSAHWGSDDVIRYSRGINVSAGMMQVSALGGEPDSLTRPVSGERWHGVPQRLPDGSVLFTVGTSEGYRAAVVGPEGQERRILEELGPAVAARWLPSGFIVFGQPGRLMAARWKPGDVQAGAPRTVLEGVHTSRHELPFFSVSDTGDLVYASGGLVRTLPVLLDREGRATAITNDRGAFQHPRFSPDDRLLAVDITWRGRSDIYVYDLQRGARRRLTHKGFNIDPLWSADGRHLVFRSARGDGGGQDIYRVRADGSGEAELLLDQGREKIPGSWTRGGSLLAVTDISAAGAFSIGVLDIASGTAELPFSSPFNVGWPVFSPAGDRIAYVSDESGREEIWLRPFPGPGAATQVTLEGGLEPVWSPDGRELFFRRGASFLAVPLGGDHGLRPGKPRALFSGRFDLSPTGHQHYAVDSAGERFAAIELGEAADPEALHLVLDWAVEPLMRPPGNSQ